MNETLLMINEEINNYIEAVEEQYRHDYSKISELSIQYISGRLEHVKEKFEHGRDISSQEEVFYFKHIKTHLLASIQYYALVQRIELKKPPRKKKKIKKYYLKELYKIKRKLRKKSFYYNYYKADSSHLDHQLFLRIDQDIFCTAGSYILDIDKRTNTPAVHLFAQIKAYEMLRHHLKKKIKAFAGKTKVSVAKTNNPLRWTTSKVDLIELTYALHAAGVFNNGRADIKEIAECLQRVFDVDLGQYNRVFYDIRARKINKTKFLDALKDGLKKRINETDNQLFI